MPKGLAASRWATQFPRVTSWPRPPPGSQGPVGPVSSSSQPLVNALSSAASRNEQPSSPEQQLSRFLKIVARLKWKIPFLEFGYGTAVDRVGKPQQEIDANEIHFKLDFHEFYMLIERALVHLMGVYGIVIYSQADPNGNGYGVGINNPNAFRDRYQQHRYHENVLLALDNPANPLHEMLGQPEKQVEERRPTPVPTRAHSIPAPLEAYNLKEILQTILLALEQAYFVTEQFIRRQHPGVGQNQPVSTADWTTDSGDWEFMVDAMDWEVV
ncbi:hypothetical protein NUW58_g6505 [Xylaria curta]|uniref:Uncharacterized protein n=1 Tax=Xylaria curta TaxID=42375 RepID=A0ACC1NUR2_9PEZI|nr:hypothetical protein NUW58_g6505 [Xylaria curta]